MTSPVESADCESIRRKSWRMMRLLKAIKTEISPSKEQRNKINGAIGVKAEQDEAGKL